MYIRQTKNNNSATGEAYFSHRLVRSQRMNGKVRQVTFPTRKATTAEPELKRIYQALGIHTAPGGIKKWSADDEMT